MISGEVGKTRSGYEAGTYAAFLVARRCRFSLHQAIQAYHAPVQKKTVAKRIMASGLALWAVVVWALTAVATSKGSGAAIRCMVQFVVGLTEPDARYRWQASLAMR